MLYNTLRQYEYILAVADAGSLTEAARQLNISQPSLSVAITRVEERLGQAVFARRKGAALEITPFGHGFVEEARGLLKHAQEIEFGTGAPAPFRFACFEDIAPWYLAATLKTLQAQFPDRVFEGTENRFAGLAEDLSQGRADLALSYNVGFDGAFSTRTIKTISPVVFLSTDHPLAARQSIALEELENHPLLLSSEDLSEGYVRNLFEARSLKPKVVARAASLESMRSLAAHGTGIGFSYACPPSSHSYDGHALVTLPVSSPEATAEIVLAWSALRTTDQAFMDIVEFIAGQ